jgi:hypothetical protein
MSECLLSLSNHLLKQTELTLPFSDKGLGIPKRLTVVSGDAAES